MYSQFVGVRLSALRQTMQSAETGKETRRQVNRLLAALEEGAFCFRMEPWHDVSLRSAFSVGAISEMLLHVIRPETSDVNIRWAISAIYESGMAKELDQIIVASALQQAEAQRGFPVAINISPESACHRDFWKELAPVLANYSPHNLIFELVEEEYIPGEKELAVMAAARKMGYRFALDDVENNPRDEKRIEAFSDYIDFIKICGVMIEEWELGLPGLSSFLSYLKDRAGHAQFIAEWVSSAAKARLLADIGFNAVQGRYLPVNRVDFNRLLVRTPARRMQMAHGGLAQAFTGIGA